MKFRLGRHTGRVILSANGEDEVCHFTNKYKSLAEFVLHHLNNQSPSVPQEPVSGANKELLDMLERLLEYKSHFRKSDIYKAADLIKKYRP